MQTAFIAGESTGMDRVAFVVQYGQTVHQLPDHVLDQRQWQPSIFNAPLDLEKRTAQKLRDQTEVRTVLSLRGEVIQQVTNERWQVEGSHRQEIPLTAKPVEKSRSSRSNMMHLLWCYWLYRSRLQ